MRPKAWTDREHSLYRDVKTSVASEAVTKERLRVARRELKEAQREVDRLRRMRD